MYDFVRENAISDLMWERGWTQDEPKHEVYKSGFRAGADWQREQNDAAGRELAATRQLVIEQVHELERFRAAIALLMMYHPTEEQRPVLAQLRDLMKATEPSPNGGYTNGD